LSRIFRAAQAPNDVIFEAFCDFPQDAFFVAHDVDDCLRRTYDLHRSR
jgi:hypothetical protein